MAAAVAQAEMLPMDMVFLGSRSMICDRGVRVLGSKSVLYPLGKAEWVNVPVAKDVIVYECGLRRARLICTPQTTLLRVRRGALRGTYDAKCYGPALVTPVVTDEEGADGEGNGEPPVEGEPGAEGTVEGTVEGSTDGAVPEP